MSSPQATYLKEYLPPNFTINQTELHFELDPQNTIVTSRLTLEKVGSDPELVLQGDELELISIQYNQQEMKADEYQVTPDSLQFSPKDTHFVLEIKTKIAPAQNKVLMGLYESSGNFCRASPYSTETFNTDRG